MHIKVGSDLAYQMRFGLTSSGHQTAGSLPTSHQTQLGEIYSGQKCWKNQHQPCHTSQFEHRDQDGEQQQQRRYFKSLQLSDVWESTMNWATCQIASFTKQIKLLTGRVCLSEDCTPTNCSERAVMNSYSVFPELHSYFYPQKSWSKYKT